MPAKRVTLRRVNAALPDGVELARGNGYFYFYGPAVDHWAGTMVCVYHLGAKTVEEWVQEYRDMARRAAMWE